MFRSFLILATFAWASIAQAKTKTDLYRSVLRIETATVEPDYKTPWNAGAYSSSIGTGFIIGKNKILTNAHVVSNGRRVLITSHGNAKKYPAKVEFIAHDCDLALLSVKDFSDLADFPILTFGEVPDLESEVRVVGYPIGGDQLSITRGVVSRIDSQTYSHTSADSHLVIQIDAAINPGNSGGPVIQDGKVIGVAFQGLEQADNTGYIIPTPVIQRFLKDISDGSYDSYTELGISHLPLQNPAMRKALKLADDNRGVLVSEVIASSSADGKIQPNDVILAIDGYPVDSDGMISLNHEYLHLTEVTERKFAGDTVTLQISRNQQVQTVAITLKPLHWAKILSMQYGKKPRYLMFAGMVFQPLDMNLISVANFTDPALRERFTQYLSKGLFKTYEDIVVLSRIESDPLTNQMSDEAGHVLAKINNIEVKSLKHANELLYSPQPPEFFVLELLGVSRPVVIPSAAVQSANSRVLQKLGVSKLSNLND